MKKSCRAGQKLKIFSIFFAISLLLFSIISFDDAFARPDELPSQFGAQNLDNPSHGKPQFISVSGLMPESGIVVHIWLMVPEGADKNETAKKALAGYGAQPFITSEKFVFNGLVWDQFKDNNPGNDFVIQNYNPTNEPQGALEALLSSQTTWTDVPSSSFVFQYGGTTNRCPSLAVECGSQNWDGFNDVAWLPIAQENVLGVTYASTLFFDEADMVMNTNTPVGFSWETDGISAIDIETVFLHENGHALGLNHEETNPAVMNPVYQGVLRNLLADDIDGVSSLYPAVDQSNPPTLVIYEDDMESGTNGWATNGNPGLWHQTTLRANSGTNSWYYGDETHNPPDYDVGANYGYLTSPLISLDGASSAVLEFYEWSSMENGWDWDRTRIQISANGVHWFTVGEFHETFGLWEKRQVDLSSWTGEDVYLRFWFDTIDDQFNNFEGWYVDDVKVLVDSTNTSPNNPPTANAGDDQNVDEDTLVNLDGSLSSDSDGVIATYAWTQTAGTIVALNGADTDTPSFIAPSVGPGGETLTFSLIVTDDDGDDSLTDTVDILVADVPVPNNPPTANAGDDQNVVQKTVVTLDGTGSFDPDDDNLTYEWVTVSGPNVKLSDSTSATPEFTAPNVGKKGKTFEFQLTVSDGIAISIDTVKIFVSQS